MPQYFLLRQTYLGPLVRIRRGEPIDPEPVARGLVYLIYQGF